MGKMIWIAEIPCDTSSAVKNRSRMAMRHFGALSSFLESFESKHCSRNSIPPVSCSLWNAEPALLMETPDRHARSSSKPTICTAPFEHVEKTQIRHTKFVASHQGKTLQEPTHPNLDPLVWEDRRLIYSNRAATFGGLGACWTLESEITGDRRTFGALRARQLEALRSTLWGTFSPRFGRHSWNGPLFFWGNSKSTPRWKLPVWDLWV